MNKLAQLFGYIFLAFAIAGAVIPGWNFYVNFADDKNAVEWHRAKAEEIDKRIRK